MSSAASWELQLAPLINTADLLTEFEPDNAVLAGFKLQHGAVSQSGRGNILNPQSSQTSPSSTLYEDKATRKTNKERVTIYSYPMDADGASRCLREATFLKRPQLWSEPTSLVNQRRLSHIVTPLGVWTTAETSYLHLAVRNPGITPLSKILDSSVLLPADIIRSILKGVLEGLDLCHSNGFSHCALNPGTVLVHTCHQYNDPSGRICSSVCDYNNAARRPFPTAPVLAQISRFEHCVEFVPTLSATSHLSHLHQTFPVYWSAPELCGIIYRPKSKLKKRILKESAGKGDIWSLGMLALTMIERNLMLSPLAPRTKDSLSTSPLRDLSVKQMSRLKTNPKIFQARRWTTLAQDFVHSCLRIDHRTRPTAAQLLKHPFLTNTNEMCLMSLSDVSESETSPLDDTYEDSTLYIPAPDSESMGGSSDDNWSGPDEGRSFRSGPSVGGLGSSSVGGRTSSDDTDHDVRKRMASYPEDNLCTSSSDESTGSVVIVGSDSDDTVHIFPPVKLPRKRGKSDAGITDASRLPSPTGSANPLTAGSSLVTSSMPHGAPLSPTSRPRQAAIRRKVSSEFIEVQMSPASNRRTSPNRPRRKNSSELLETLVIPHETMVAAQRVTQAGSSPTSPSAFPEPESPNYTSMIAIHTHKSSSSARGTLETANRRHPSNDRASAAAPPSSGFTPSSSFNSATSGGMSSSGSLGKPSLGNATSAVYSIRERTPSPAKHAISSYQNPGRRSSLPLLPMMDVMGPTSPHAKYSPTLPSPTIYQPSAPTSPQRSTSSSSSLSWESGEASKTLPGPVSPVMSTKAASLTEPFRPSYLSHSMRSKSEDTLIDKEMAAALNLGPALNPNVYNLATGTIAHTPNELLSPTSYNQATSMQRSTSGQSMPASPSSASFVSSMTPSSSGSKSSRKRAKKAKAAWDQLKMPSSGLLSTTDESLQKEIDDTEVKWIFEIKKRVKVLEQKEKEIADKFAARLRTARKHYDAQVSSLSKRDEHRNNELKTRMAAEKTKLMSERAKELDRDGSPIGRRNSFSGSYSTLQPSHSGSSLPTSPTNSSPLASATGSSTSLNSTSSSHLVISSVGSSSSSMASSHSSSNMFGFTTPLSSGRKPSFPRRVLHLNYERSVHDMDRRHLLERQDIELKSIEDAAAIEREYAVQKYLAEQLQLEQIQEAQRQCIDDTFALKWKMVEEVKTLTRKWIAKRIKKMGPSDSVLKAIADDPTSAVDHSIWQFLMSPMASPKTNMDAQPGASLSALEILPEFILAPAELSCGVQERFQISVDMQKWKQEEELALLGRDVQLAENYKEESTALNQRHALELAELRHAFEAHYVHTRQEAFVERLNRLTYYENELVELKYRFARRMVVKTEETDSKLAYDTLESLQKADLETIANIHAAKRQQLTALVASIYPIKPISASSSFSLSQPPSSYEE